MEAATAAKDEGNAHFRAKRFTEAKTSYRKAVESLAAENGGNERNVKPLEAQVRSNWVAASLALVREGREEASLEDLVAECDLAVAADPSYTKARFRRSQVRALISPATAESIRLALEDAREVCRREPGDKAAASLAGELVVRAQKINAAAHAARDRPQNISALVGDVRAGFAGRFSFGDSQEQDVASGEQSAGRQPTPVQRKAAVIAVRQLVFATRAVGKADALVREGALSDFAAIAVAAANPDTPLGAESWTNEDEYERAIVCGAWRILSHVCESDSTLSREKQDDEEASAGPCEQLMRLPHFGPMGITALVRANATAVEQWTSTPPRVSSSPSSSPQQTSDETPSDALKFSCSVLRHLWSLIEARRGTKRAQSEDEASQQAFQECLFEVMRTMQKCGSDDLQLSVLTEVVRAPLFATMHGSYSDGSNDGLPAKLSTLLKMADRSVEHKNMVSVALNCMYSAHQALESSKSKTETAEPAKRFKQSCEAWCAKTMGTASDIMEAAQHHNDQVVDLDQEVFGDKLANRHVSAMSGLSSMILANVELGVDYVLRDNGGTIQAMVGAVEFAEERSELSVATGADDAKRSARIQLNFQKLRFLVAEVFSLAAGNTAFQKSLDKTSFLQIMPLFEMRGGPGDKTGKYSDLATSAMITVMVAKLCAVNEHVRLVAFGDDEREDAADESDTSNLTQGVQQEADAVEPPKPALAVSATKVKYQITKIFVCILRSIQEKDERSLCLSIEALSYFCVFPWVKEYLVKQSAVSLQTTLFPLIQNAYSATSEFKISKASQQRLWFPFASVFEYLMRFLDGDGREGDPELEEMREKITKFAQGDKEALKKFYIDPADKDEAVLHRCERLVLLGGVPALHALVMQMQDARDHGVVPDDGPRRQTPILSRTAATSLANSLLSICRPIPTRGKVVQDGGVKSLLTLIAIAEAEGPRSSEPEEWKAIRLRCAHGLARLAIAVDPAVAFTESTATKLTSAIRDILRAPEEGLPQYEALMAMTNLCLLGHPVISIMLGDGGASRIENVQLSSQPLVQRAAVELACNLTQYEPFRLSFRVASPVLNPEHPQYDEPSAKALEDFFRQNDTTDVSQAMEVAETRTERQLKIFAGLSCGDDEKTAVAASGALAMLSGDGVIAARIMEVCKLQPFIDLVGGDAPPAEGEDGNPDAFYTTGDLQHRAAEVLKNCILLGRTEAKRVVDAGAVGALVKCLARPMSEGAAETASIALKALQRYDMIRPGDRQ